MPPVLTIRLDCEPCFLLPARYVFVMLGMMCGFRPHFVSRKNVDISYASSAGDAVLRLPAMPGVHRRLLEKSPITLVLQRTNVYGIDCHTPFLVNGRDGIAFDLPASAFFFLSLHEQWSSDVRDAFGRFPARASVLGNSELFHTPLVARYAQAFRAALLNAGLSVKHIPRFGGRRSAVCMTHDIDYLSKYTPALLYREVVKYFLFNRRGVSVSERTRRMREYIAFGLRRKDPYILSIHNMLEGERRNDMRASYLLKAGGNDKRDVSYSIRGGRARAIIARIIDQGHDVGLHPSYNSYLDEGMFARETAVLSDLLGRQPLSVRQHYLRFAYPDTWRLQAKHGFIVDSTLGFAEQEGFRNGMCHPFLPFDLERQEIIPLWEIPLTVMDGTMKHYRGLNPSESLQSIRSLLSVTQQAAGVAVLLFHNTAFDEHDFPGWGQVFDTVADEIGESADVLAASLPEIAHEWMQSTGWESVDDIVSNVRKVPD